MPSTSDAPWDVIVVGAGAAGMMAAIESGRRGARTLLVEKNRKPGVKILMSGGTRCNLTHATDAQGIVDAFGRQGRFLRTPLRHFDPDRTVQFFHDAGVPTKVEATGKVFPISDRALDVQRAMWGEVQKAGVQSVLDEGVDEIDFEKGMWHLRTTDHRWRGRRLIVTTGGCSYPKCGTRGDAYAWMSKLGHTVVEPRPALVPLRSDESWVAELSGVTLTDTLVRVVPADRLQASQDVAHRLSICRKANIAQRRTSLLFTHFGVSGPAAMDVSREFTARENPSDLILVCDLLPNVDADDLSAQLHRDIEGMGTRSIGRWLAERLPHRLSDTLLSLARIDTQRRLAELNKEGRRAILRQVKSLEINIVASRGFAKAEVTAGGVSLREIDSRSMASKQIGSLYVAGELLDVDGPIGGYNFQAAFSTGWTAGRAAAESG